MSVAARLRPEFDPFAHLFPSFLKLRSLLAEEIPVGARVSRSPVRGGRVLEQTGDPRDQVFALAEQCDATQLDLSAAEGYLLSRIDGTTPWRLLREIGGIPSDEVDACLTRWLEAGLLECVGGRAEGSGSAARGTGSARDSSGSKQAAAAGASAGGSAAKESARDATDAAEAPTGSQTTLAIDESALDDSLEIGLDVQRRILQYEANLGLPYHELLGVEKGAQPKLVKRAYFKLSKEFHPDRYFRKEIGEYGERLDRIFKKVLEAHEILSDPELCQVENQTVVDPPDASQPTSTETSATSSATTTGPAPTKPAKSKQAAKLERLRQRMPFKINHAAIAERRARADEIFRAAQLSQEAGRMQEAEQSIRIAISFDPGRAEFKEALGALKIQAAGARATKLLATPTERMKDGELREAIRLLEDILPYKPHDPELNEHAARVCLRLGQLDDAQEYAETLLERNPEYAAGHALLGRVHKDRGDKDAAVRAFETALKYDEDDRDAQRGLAAVRIGARDEARGGMS